LLSPTLTGQSLNTAGGAAAPVAWPRLPGPLDLRRRPSRVRWSPPRPVRCAL